MRKSQKLEQAQIRLHHLEEHAREQGRVRKGMSSNVREFMQRSARNTAECRPPPEERNLGESVEIEQGCNNAFNRSNRQGTHHARRQFSPAPWPAATPVEICPVTREGSSWYTGSEGCAHKAMSRQLLTPRSRKQHASGSGLGYLQVGKRGEGRWR
jgi:hypothetical protein